MQLFKTRSGNILRSQGKSWHIGLDWDSLINQEDLHKYLSAFTKKNALDETEADLAIANGTLPPIGTQEVWAAGVTYLRSHRLV